MTFTVYFTVDGLPVGKQRPRFSKVGGFVKTYTPKKTADYESAVKESATKAMGSSEPLETPVAAYVYIKLPVPKSYSSQRKKDCLYGFEKPTKKPDLDNIVKSVLDALNGVVYQDDCQIISIHATKCYASEPGVDVMIKEDLE